MEHPFIEECLPLMNWPFFSEYPGQILPCAVALFIKAIYKTVDDADALWFLNVRKEAMKIGILSIEEKVALAAGSALTDPRVAQGLLEDTTTDMAPWMGHFRWCAGERPGIVDRARWAMRMQPGENKILSWLLVRSYMIREEKYLAMCSASEVWQNRISKDHPNLMGDVFGAAFGAEHPFAKWMKGRL